jgi:hypothetical protein
MLFHSISERDPSTKLYTSSTELETPEDGATAIP